MPAPNGESAPADAAACFEDGNAAFRRGDAARAAAAYERAVALWPAHADAWLNLGAAYRRLERLDDAATCARRVLELRPDDSRALNNLANVLNALGLLDEAARCYRRALQIRPGDAETFYNLVNQQPLNDGSAESEALFASLLRQAEATDSLSIREHSALHFALGKALEARDEADLAFESFARANALHRSTLRFDISASERMAEIIAQQFDTVNLDRLRGAASPSGRPIFVVGMPRSGTTLVEQIISAHPMVHGAGEIGVLGTLAARVRGADGSAFPYWTQPPSAGDLQHLAGDYLSALDRLDGAKPRVTDKTVGNFQILGLIHLLLPNARIVHCRRDPRDVGVSCFTTRFSSGHDYAYDLGELGRYLKLYDRMMTHWRAALPPGRIFDVDYETLVEDLEGGARRLLDHLGLPWDEACLRFYESRRSVGTASFAQVRRPIYKGSVGRWRRYEARLGPLLEVLDAPRKAAVSPRP